MDELLKMSPKVAKILRTLLDAAYSKEAEPKDRAEARRMLACYGEFYAHVLQVALQTLADRAHLDLNFEEDPLDE